MTEQEQKTETVIVLDKVRWARGEIPKYRFANFLVSGCDGSLCCLGYCMGQLGFPIGCLVGNGQPQDAAGECGQPGCAPDFLVHEEEQGSDMWGERPPNFTDSILVTEAISINDDERLTDDERIFSLNNTFEHENIKFILVDTPQQCETAGGLPANYTEKYRYKRGISHEAT